MNCLEAMVETCLPVEEGETGEAVRPTAALGSHLGGSLGSLALPSPTDRGNHNLLLTLYVLSFLFTFMLIFFNFRVFF